MEQAALGCIYSIGSSVLLMLGAIGSVFYIGFKVQANGGHVIGGSYHRLVGAGLLRIRLRD